MTNSERAAAIAYIKRYRKLDEDLHNNAPKGSASYIITHRCLQYWDMAIQALNSLEEVYFKGYNDGFTKAEDNYKNDKVLSEKTGEWIPKPYELDYQSDAECSVCHELIINAIYYHYCPKCGAKMIRR